jgi:hypothetical protein
MCICFVDVCPQNIGLLCIIIWYFCLEKKSPRDLFNKDCHQVILTLKASASHFILWRLMMSQLPLYCNSVHQCVLSACWLKLSFIYFLFSCCRCFLLPSNLCLGRCRINLTLTYYAWPLVRGEGQRDGCCTSRGRIFNAGKPLVFEVRVNRDATC